MSFFGERYDNLTKQFMADFSSAIPFTKQASEKEAGVKEELIHTKLFDILNQHFGKEWWDWEPETVMASIESNGIFLDESAQNVFQAYQVILNTNQAHENWHVFEKVGHAFNDNVVDFTVVQPLRTDECAMTLKVLREVRPKEYFDSEVHSYVACCAKNDGLVYLPEEYFGKEFQEALDKLGNDPTLKASVESLWKSGKTSHEDAAINIQLKSLEELKNYVGGAA